MEKLVVAFAPAFAAGFAVQRFVEILDMLSVPLEGWFPKKAVTGVISLIAGLSLAWSFDFMRILKPLAAYAVAQGVRFDPAAALDVVVTGLFISAGTEGFNSILKFLGYAKDAKWREAASSGRASSLAK